MSKANCLSVSRQCEGNALENASTRLNPVLYICRGKRADYTGMNEALVDLIKEHNKWVEPEAKETA